MLTKPKPIGILFLALGSFAATARAELRSWDGKYPIDKIEVNVVYFVPQDRTPLADWRRRVDYFCRRIERFHQRELDGQSKLVTKVSPEPFRSSKATEQLRAGDGDFIFFETLREVDGQLHVGRGNRGAYPILLVLSDVNWKPLDAFTACIKRGRSSNSTDNSSTGGTSPVRHREEHGQPTWPTAASAGDLSVPTVGACLIADQTASSITKESGMPSDCPILSRATDR